MRTAATLTALTVAAGALAFGPAVTPDAEASCTLIRGAETEDVADDVEACRQDVWFHGAGLPLDNLDAAQGQYVPWDTDAPTASVTDGAGNGWLADSALHQQSEPFQDPASFVAAGTFDGAIDNVVVELYLFTPGTNVDDPANPVVGEDHSVDAQLSIDGVPVQTIADRVVTLHAAGDAVQRVTFAFRDVSEVMELVGELGGEHTIEVRVHGTTIVSDVAGIVYDTTEVPSGLVFNAPAALLAEVD